MRNLLVLFLLFMTSSLYGQFTYKMTKLEPIPAAAKVNPAEIEEGFYQSLTYISPPDHLGNEVTRAKAEAEKRFPRKPSNRISTRGLAEPPTVQKGFESAVSGSTPTDNTLAVGNDGTNVSGANRSIKFQDEDGNQLRIFSLSSFSQGVPANTNQYDPRAIYDPEADRYCVTWLAGTSSNSTSILMAFSSSADVMDEWTVYSIEGSPFGTPVWTDYPMLALTKDAVILTVNLIKDNVSWELGFSETIIYEIDKQTAYDGADNLDVNLYSDINFEEKPIRNLHPVKSADEVLEEEQYFLSNRNFDVVNDTFFLLKLSDALEIDFRVANQPYGAPPNAKQPEIGNDLQTNDARVLDAFRLDDHIQFVGNTMDMATGKSAIYHGFIDQLNTDKNLTTTLLTHPTRDLGYPGIAWTGRLQDETEAIVVAEYTSEVEFAGFSALYIDQDRDCSDWIDVRTGGSYVRGSGTVRWGDYVGAQRQFNVPGVVWVSCMHTSSIGVPVNYNVLLTAPNSDFVSVESLSKPKLALSVSPNPLSERVTVLMDIPAREQLRITLHDLQGREVVELFNDRAKKVGQLEYSFDLRSLEQGMYLFTATLGDKEIASKKIIKN